MCRVASGFRVAFGYVASGFSRTCTAFAQPLVCEVWVGNPPVQWGMPHMMEPLHTIDDLDAAIAGSSTRPALVFKHSTTCGTSAFAHEEVESLIEEQDSHANVFIVDVRASRLVSAAIAERTGIRHESPQALLFVNGKVVWHASHHRITRDALTAAIG